LVWVFIAKETGLSQLQTDFVSKVSHELKTPLTSIRLFVDTLKMRRASNPEQVEECLDLISKETQRLHDRIEQLLEWGRMEAGRRVYALQLDDVGETVREATTHFAPLNLQGDVDFLLSIQPDLPKALVDRPALVMAVLNLLSNAYKDGGRPRQIEVTVDADPARKRVRIHVKDNGNGLPLPEHKRIFQKFYRRDDRLSRVEEGSGLGLAIVAHVARGHRGDVKVESAPGHGATFVISIPVADEP
jgi:two-component system phosphate regulon sensor histidine kinase PhoR